MLKSYADGAAERAFDRLLLAAALTIADAVQVSEERVSVDLPYASHAILAIAPRSRIFYRVNGPGGALITGYDGLAGKRPEARSTTPEFSYVRFLDASVRVVQLGRFISARGVEGWVTIVSGETREDRDAFAREILVNGFLPTLAMVLAATGSIWLVIRRALKPLADVERAIAARKPTDFSPIGFDAPHEVHQLIATLNSLLKRFGVLLSRMQDFLGDAAHQIRTPLASLQAQVDVALDETDLGAVKQRLERVRRNAHAVTHLANQLLADTMVAHRGESVPFAPVEVADLCSHILETSWSQGIDLAYRSDCGDYASWVLGDDVMLSEALKNLIDNARKYGGGQDTIQLEVAATAGTVRVSVSDHGPGIAEHDRAHLTKRFARGAEADRVAGSGLGLAIVADVLERHKGTLQFKDRPGGGLTVEMSLPRILAPSPAGSS